MIDIFDDDSPGDDMAWLAMELADEAAHERSRRNRNVLILCASLLMVAAIYWVMK